MLFIAFNSNAVNSASDCAAKAHLLLQNDLREKTTTLEVEQLILQNKIDADETAVEDFIDQQRSQLRTWDSFAFPLGGYQHPQEPVDPTAFEPIDPSAPGHSRDFITPE